MAHVPTPSPSDESGAGLVDVLVAMTMLLVGILGTMSMIDGANAASSTIKGRVGATNLARELVEASRSVEYGRLTDALVAGELQTRPGLADAGAAPGWQIRRRNILYTVAASACIFDDATDGTGTHDASFCANSATSPGGDQNPDDYRRATFAISWRDGQVTREVSQTAILTNPAGGLGPRIASFTGTPAMVGPGTNAVAFAATTTLAQTVRWSADDGGVGGDASGGPTAWSFSWELGPVGTFSCSASPGWVLDGTYMLTAQAFDDRGVPGDLKTFTTQVDRSAPAPPCGLAGGRNGSIVDLQWRANEERDIAGYRVFRTARLGETADVEVCALTTRTSCYDSNPPAAALDPIEYYVVADDAAQSTASASLVLDDAPNVRPNPPGLLSALTLDGNPTLEWTAATDPDGTIAFYRIYKGATQPSQRYDIASDVQRLYTDGGADGGAQYWITAVDNRFRESVAVGPVTP
jgi:Tfp pilus assembly protein PilV